MNKTIEKYYIIYYKNTNNEFFKCGYDYNIALKMLKNIQIAYPNEQFELKTEK